MQGEGRGSRSVVYCVVPQELAARLHEPLRKHFADDRLVDVVVERRLGERRSPRDRRAADVRAIASEERRRIRNSEGRRVADRRATAVIVDPPGALPRRARSHAGSLTFVERVEPSTERQEDADTSRLVIRIQAGDREAFEGVYMRYFDRVYGYLKLALNDAHEAEDATQQVFIKAFEALPRYERRKQPFRAWLFVIARNYALGEVERRRRAVVVDSTEIDWRREDTAPDDRELGVMNWISDRDLLLFIERLPEVQRQVLAMRYMLDLSYAEIAQIMDRSLSDVRRLNSRAVSFLRQRLSSLGREGRRDNTIRMRRWRKQATVLRRRRYALQ